MTGSLRLERRPTLRRPVLVAAFRGWNDGAQGASLAASYLAQSWDARRFADFDPEEYFDFQATRPHVVLEEGMTRRIDWPETVFYHAEIPETGRDAVLLLGIEPNLRWRTFSDEVVGLASELGVELVVSLGALLADVPHTRPAPVTGSASDPALVRELGLAASRYEGPTGIVGVLHDLSNRAGLPSVSFWAAVPHYVPAAVNPKAAAALVQRVSSFLDLSVDMKELMEAMETWEQRVSQLVAEDETLTEYVQRLEEAASEEPPLPLVSGESLAAELERYLRERDGGREGST